MKVVFISSSYYPSIGGVETHVEAVARELIKRGHRVTVLTEYQRSTAKSDNKAKKSKSNVKSTHFIHRIIDQIDIYYFKFGQESFFKKFRIWHTLFKNRRLLEDADIVHCHDVFIWYFPLRFWFWDKKVFTTFHGYETVFPPTNKAKLIRKISEKLSNGNIAVGDFIKKWYGTNPDYVTYGGVSKISNFKFKVLNESKKNKKIKILLVGRLEKDMGIILYRDALRMLRDKGFLFELTVLGEGSLKPEIETYGKILGFIKDLKTIIKKSDIIFSSSYLTMLQVLQLGKPVFAVYTNPLKHDYLRNSPFEKYIDISGSEKDLKEKIVRFRPNVKKLGAASKWANGETWGKIADIYLDLWAKNK